VTTVDNLRKAARRWLKSLREGDPEAGARLARAYPGAPKQATLRDVQHALARERGHESWVALTRAVVDRSASATPLTALLSAAGKGDGTAVVAILDQHPDIINERGTLPGNTGLRTALHFGSGHEAVVRTLLERGADPNIRDDGDNAFPIHFAAERGDLAVVKLLIEHGADPIGAGTTHELDVLGWAVCFDYAMHVEVARYLLAHGARHTLLSAVAMGEAGVVRAFAAAGADLNQRMDSTNKRRTPLHLAVVKKQVTALAALIELGADLNLEDAVGLTPLDQAALDGEDEMVRLLVDAGASITLPAAIVLEQPDQIERLVRENPEALSTTNNRQWARLLVHASSRVSARVMERLLRTVMRHRSGLSIVNMEDDKETAVDGASGYTPLHAAAFHGNDDAAAVLLKHGANPRTRDGKYCGTPAGWAAYAGHMATANLILDAGIDIFDAINFDRADRVNDILDCDPGAIDRPFKAYASCESRDDQWWPAPDSTPLQWATMQRKPNAVHILTERGAGARPADDIQRAALDEHERFVQACFRLDADEAKRLLLAHPEYLQSPVAMFDAAKRDRPDLLALLLDLGFALEVQDQTGKRALHEAAARNALRAAIFLLERGAEVDPRESSYNGTPIGWAAHGDRREMVELLSRQSRDIWTLCVHGYVERVRDILTEDPSRARVISKDGDTPLWWLPDDEAKAMQIVALLVAAGTDPAAKNNDGGTAADWARRRGMNDVATRLE
jgi:ankyrin repeat protein